MARQAVFNRVLPRLTSAERVLDDLEDSVSEHIRRLETEQADFESQKADLIDGIRRTNRRLRPHHSSNNMAYQLGLDGSEDEDLSDLGLTDYSEDEDDQLYNDFLHEPLSRQELFGENLSDYGSDEEAGWHARHDDFPPDSNDGLDAQDLRDKKKTLKEERDEYLELLEEVEGDLSVARDLEENIRTLSDLWDEAQQLALAGKGTAAVAVLRRLRREANRVEARLAELQPHSGPHDD